MSDNIHVTFMLAVGAGDYEHRRKDRGDRESNQQPRAQAG
jgi:hypothetical protein